jgi:hypothetical protein
MGHGPSGSRARRLLNAAAASWSFAGFAAGCTSGGGGAAAVASCAAPGGPTLGPSDTHCVSPDGGMIVQPTLASSCLAVPDAGGDDGGAAACPYAETAYGYEAADDACKYDVHWSSTPICEGTAGVVFTVVATQRTDGTPLTGAGLYYVEAFTTSPPDSGCDDVSMHPSSSAQKLEEGAPGTYTTRIVFDVPGQWTVRFHFHAECYDLVPTSPHGHVAFHITVP